MGLANLRRIRILAIDKIRIHTDTGQQHLTDRVCHTGNSCRLTKEVTPALDPGENRDLIGRYDVLCDKVHPSGGGICRY